jgi:transposase InsO family protein
LYSAHEQSIVDFLFEDIFTRFGVPQEIVRNQGTQITSNLVKSITKQYQIKHRKYSPYHPQANEQVESTNKVIEAILTKIV